MKEKKSKPEWGINIPKESMHLLEPFSIEKTMCSACEAPHRYPIDKQPDIRRIRMKRFPFTMLLREHSGFIHVLAVAHNRRRPQFWLGRL